MFLVTKVVIIVTKRMFACAGIRRQVRSLVGGWVAKRRGEG